MPTRRLTPARTRLAVRLLAALLTATGAASCVPPARVVVTPQPVLTYQQKMAWILQLEDERILRAPAPAPAPAPAVVPDLMAALQASIAAVGEHAERW
ncbi:MAG: hypothetical protein KGN76_16675, partial [Acidobacteriota bacterium]|nr:hypothetical protein [Acidobacteriota bacterium]